MNLNAVEVEGMLQPDGTLVLQANPNLPPGRVRVTVQPVVDPTSADQFWAGLRAIGADQQARGHVPRDKADIDAEIKTLRDEVEEEMSAVERLHRDAENQR
jgi:hypothetical protein